MKTVVSLPHVFFRPGLCCFFSGGVASCSDTCLTCILRLVSCVSVQELQRDIQQHTEGVESVLGLCEALLRDEDAAGSGELEGDSVQETSRSLERRWRSICTLALDRRLR